PGADALQPAADPAAGRLARVLPPVAAAARHAVSRAGPVRDDPRLRLPLPRRFPHPLHPAGLPVRSGDLPGEPAGVSGAVEPAADFDPLVVDLDQFHGPLDLLL